MAFTTLAGLAGLIIYLVSVVFFRRYRQWLFYYLVGSFGFVLIVVIFARWAGLETQLISTQLKVLAPALALLGIPSTLLPPDQIQIANTAGFSILDLNIECSSLIEFSVLGGLLAFLPAFNWSRKMISFTLGLLFLYLLNIARLLIIAYFIYFYGPTMVFVGHAVIGRLFFFLGVVFLFWAIFTGPSLSIVRNQLENPAT